MAKLPPRLSPEVLQRVVALAWEELPPFPKIQLEHGISPAELTALMKRTQTSTAYKKWAARNKSEKKSPADKTNWPYGR